MKEFFQTTLGCGLLIALFLLLSLGGTAWYVWYTYHITPAVINAERHVTTCSMQYLTTQKARISDDLLGISTDNVSIAQTNTGDAKQDSRIVASLQQQQQTNADDIYRALDASQCSRQQIIQDMPELSSFFQKYQR